MSRRLFSRLEPLCGLSLVGLVGLAGLAACNDTGGGDATQIAGDASSAGGRADFSIITAGGSGGSAQGGGSGGEGSGGTAGAAIPVGGDGGSGGSGGVVARDCDPGRQRCVADGDSSLEVCNEAGEWGLDVCPDGAPCYDNRCLPSPADCRAGERLCITNTTPAICEPGVTWTPQPECAAGETCANGDCVSQACALAALNRSYLGCDYWAVELPNISLMPLGGATPDAPIGVVVVNADEVEPAHLTVLDPRRQVANLVATMRIQPPEAGLGQPSFQPETVSSEVRDQNGRVVEPNVARAEGLEIPPGGVATILLPRVPQFDDSSQVGPIAFRLKTDRPIAAYQFNPYCCNYTYSNDASLLIPSSALGTDYRFLGVPAWTSPLQGSTVPAGMAIVATEDNTEITVNLPRGIRVAADRGRRVVQNGAVVSLTLNAHDTAILQTEGGGGFGATAPDFSGSAINSTSPVAVFSTHQCSFYPETIEACDHLEEELFPSGTLGRQYVLTPPVFRQRRPQPTEVIYWKILAVAANTRVTLSRPFAQLDAVPPGFAGVPDCADFLEPDGVTLVLGENGFCEFGTQVPVALDADNLLEVMGIMVGQNATSPLAMFGDHAGDPAIFLLPPDLQYRDDYAFLVPGTYENDWLTVIADADTELTLDGQPLDLAGADGVPGTSRVYKHVSLTDGGHRIRGNRPFGIIVYAFDDYVSYAFTGGLNLEKR